MHNHSRHDEQADVSILLRKIDEKFCSNWRQREKESALVQDATPNDIARLSQFIDFSAAHQPDEVLDEAADFLTYRTQTDHPRFVGFVPCPMSPLSVAGDVLISIHNAHASSRLGASGVAVLERDLIAWLAAQVGLPDSAGGLFCSGASMANLTCLTAARDQNLGIDSLARGTVYLSNETHFSVIKALKVLGLGSSCIRFVPVNRSLRMDVHALQAMISQDRRRGMLPFAVIANCGTTNTGAIDPLCEVAHVAQTEGLWLHIDGAYGASVTLSGRNKHLVEGLALADSLSWDAHKWLFQTYGCGIALLRDQKKLADTFATDASYVRDATSDHEIPNYWNMGIELTRPARAVKLWFTLRVLGVERLGQMIDHGIDLAKVAERELRKSSNWEVLSPAQIGILVFRYRPPNVSSEFLNVINTSISKCLINEHQVGMFTTTIGGVVALRMCMINPELKEPEVVRILGSSSDVAEQVLTELNCFSDQA